MSNNKNSYRMFAVVGDTIEATLGTIQNEIQNFLTENENAGEGIAVTFDIGSIQIVPLMMPDPNVKLLNGKGQAQLIPRFYAHCAINKVETDLSGIQSMYNQLLKTGMRTIEEMRPADPDPN